MQISDRIYGQIEITSPLIIEIINSQPFQRLKKISQDGAPHFLQPRINGTRYEHSIGVWHLSKLFKRSIEEQVASLLHDVPHTAFSHVIDYVMNDEKQEFHERFFEKIIVNSEIPAIIDTYGIDITIVMDMEKFSLLENELPDISTDRLDYCLRDGFMMGYLPKFLIDEILTQIKFDNDHLYFEDVRLASTLAILFMNFTKLIWSDPNSIGAFNLLANAIKVGYEDGKITEEDFFKDDEALMNQLVQLNDPRINDLLSRLQPGKFFRYAPKKSAEFYNPNKARFINPLVKAEKGLQRVTELVPNLETLFQEFIEYRYLGIKPLG